MFADLNGLVAEWLGSGLQNRVQRFESARDLAKTPENQVFFFVLSSEKKKKLEKIRYLCKITT